MRARRRGGRLQSVSNLNRRRKGIVIRAQQAWRGRLRRSFTGNFHDLESLISRICTDREIKVAVKPQAVLVGGDRPGQGHKEKRGVHGNQDRDHVQNDVRGNFKITLAA
jgi:hypothetical protein